MFDGTVRDGAIRALVDKIIPSRDTPNTYVNVSQNGPCGKRKLDSSDDNGGTVGDNDCNTLRAPISPEDYDGSELTGDINRLLHTETQKVGRVDNHLRLDKILVKIEPHDFEANGKKIHFKTLYTSFMLFVNNIRQTGLVLS